MEQDYDLAWTVQNFDDAWWWYDEFGIANGPFVSFDEANDALGWYSYNWDIRYNWEF